MFRKSGFFVVGVLALAVWAFWPTYVATGPGKFDRYTHVHAALMVAWFGLLVVQPLLINRERRHVHRLLGRISYGLAPALVVVTFLLTRSKITAESRAGIEKFGFFFWMPLSMNALFALAYVQAIRHRKNMALHARYMLATLVGVVDPIVARIVYANFWQPSNPALIPIVSYAITALVLGILIVRERDAKSGRSAFPIMLIAVTVAYAMFYTFAQTSAWTDVLIALR